MNKQVMENVISAIRGREQHLKTISSSIDIANFSHLASSSSSQQTAKITSVDGGQTEVFATPTFAVYVLRVAGVVYQNNTCMQRSSQTWFALLSFEDNSLVVDLFDEQGERRKEVFLLSSLVPFPPQNDFLSFSPCAGFVREYLELQECQRVAGDLKQGDILIRDGLLSNLSVHPQLSELSAFCQQQGIVLLGFAKTTTMKTEQGESLPGALACVAPRESWYYNYTRDHTLSNAFSTFFVKLHARSNYIFHVETLSDAEPSLIFSQLAQHACDPIFLGYPYSLIAVDQLARVNNQEQSYFKTLFEARAGSLWKELEPQRKALDAHHILDIIR